MTDLLEKSAQFRTMTEGTQEDWDIIRAHMKPFSANGGARVLDHLRLLDGDFGGFPVDRLTHCLQTATLAERAGADDEVVFASLMHDVGKAITVANHGAISAEMIKPYVRDDVYQMIRVHQDFQGKHYYHHFGGDPDAREQHRESLSEEQFELAARLADEWDQIAFDDEYDTLPLEHFEPLVRRITSKG